MSGEIPTSPSVLDEIRTSQEVKDVTNIYNAIGDQLAERDLQVESMDTIAILSLATVLNSGNVSDTLRRYESFSNSDLTLESLDTAATLTLASVLKRLTTPQGS